MTRDQLLKPQGRLLETVTRASLFHGKPFRRLVIPGIIVATIYWLNHLEDWNGYEIGGIAIFQTVLISTRLCLFAGQFKLAIIIIVVFAASLSLIASIARSL